MNDKSIYKSINRIKSLKENWSKEITGFFWLFYFDFVLFCFILKLDSGLCMWIGIPNWATSPAPNCGYFFFQKMIHIISFFIFLRQASPKILLPQASECAPFGLPQHNVNRDSQWKSFQLKGVFESQYWRVYVREKFVFVSQTNLPFRACCRIRHGFGEFLSLFLGQACLCWVWSLPACTPFIKKQRDYLLWGGGTLVSAFT